MLLTFALTVLVDLTVAIGVGVTLASLLFMHQMSQSDFLHAQGRKIRDTYGGGKEDTSQREDLPEGVEVFRISGPLFFGMAGAMLDTLHAMGETPKVLILRMKLVPYMDVAGLNVISDLVKTCQSKGSKIVLSGLQAQPKDILSRAGIKHDQETVFIVPSYDEAIALSLRLLNQEA
jgi:SulP family sulfate permease